MSLPDLLTYSLACLLAFLLKWTPYLLQILTLEFVKEGARFITLLCVSLTKLFSIGYAVLKRSQSDCIQRYLQVNSMRCTLLHVSVWELKEDIYKVDVTDVSRLPVQTVRVARVGFYAHRCLSTAVPRGVTLAVCHLTGEPNFC